MQVTSQGAETSGEKAYLKVNSAAPKNIGGKQSPRSIRKERLLENTDWIRVRKNKKTSALAMNSHYICCKNRELIPQLNTIGEKKNLIFDPGLVRLCSLLLRDKQRYLGYGVCWMEVNCSWFGSASGGLQTTLFYVFTPRGCLRYLQAHRGNESSRSTPWLNTKCE